MTNDGSAKCSLDGVSPSGRTDDRRSVVMTTLLGRGRRRLRMCHRCVVCGCVSWLLLTQLVIDSVQGKSFTDIVQISAQIM